MIGEKLETESGKKRLKLTPSDPGLLSGWTPPILELRISLPPPPPPPPPTAQLAQFGHVKMDLKIEGSVV